MPLMLCVILEDFTINETPEEVKCNLRFPFVIWKFLQFGKSVHTVCIYSIWDILFDVDLKVRFNNNVYHRLEKSIRLHVWIKFKAIPSFSIHLSPDHLPFLGVVRGQTLLYYSSTVWVLSNLQQDLLHVTILPWRIDQLCDLLLQGPRQCHELDKLAFWAFVNL